MYLLDRSVRCPLPSYKVLSLHEAHGAVYKVVPRTSTHDPHSARIHRYLGKYLVTILVLHLADLGMSSKLQTAVPGSLRLV